MHINISEDYWIFPQKIDSSHKTIEIVDLFVNIKEKIKVKGNEMSLVYPQ